MSVSTETERRVNEIVAEEQRLESQLRALTVKKRKVLAADPWIRKLKRAAKGL